MSRLGELAPEFVDLMEHEKVIEQGLATFIDVGWALVQIRDGKKYRHAGYATFEDYCQRRWEMTPRHGRRLMHAAEIADVLGPAGPIPQREAQVRPLAPLKDEPDAARDAWADAVAEADGGQPTAKQVEDAVTRRRQSADPPAPPANESAPAAQPANPPVVKPDLGNGVSHPARFSGELLPVFADLLAGYLSVLDPFAGTGRIHELRRWGHTTIGVEIEPEWAAMHDGTVVGDALNLKRFTAGQFDAICTSPTYGNRLADHHDAADPDRRRSYTHDLGRPLADNNSGQLQWGTEYKGFHRKAWKQAVRVLRPGGRFVLNIKDHIRDGKRQAVSRWHREELEKLGLVLVDHVPVGAPSLRQGTNGHLRITAELVLAFDKPVAP